jgi:hypothetical protein
MRKLLLTLAVVAIAGAAAGPAAAHEGHASCQAMGALVSGEAQDPEFSARPSRVMRVVGLSWGRLAREAPARILLHTHAVGAPRPRSAYEEDHLTRYSTATERSLVGPYPAPATKPCFGAPLLVLTASAGIQDLRQRGARVDAELLADVGQVALDRARGDEQRLREFPIRQPSRRVLGNLRFESRDS